MAERDFVDDLVAQWGHERPDLDLAPVETVGRLARLHAHLLRAVEQVVAEHGMQIGEFDVLAALRRAGAPYSMRPTVLARVLMLSPAGMTSRLDRLESRGVVERRPDPDDRRSSLVALTTRGREIVDKAMTDHVANEERLLFPLTTRERRTLDALLRKLLLQFEQAPSELS